MSSAKRPNILYQDKLLGRASTSAAISATVTLPCCTTDGDYRVDKFELQAPGGYATDATNYYVVTLQARLQAFTAVAATDLCTITGHGFVQGQSLILTTTSALPAGLTANVEYFVILKSVNTFQLATSLVNATAGTAVDITDTGTGTHTSAVLLGTYSLLTGAQATLTTLVFANAVLAADPVGLKGDQLNVVLTKAASGADFPIGSVFNVHLKQLTAS